MMNRQAQSAGWKAEGELVYLVYPDVGTVDRLGDALHGAGFQVLSMRSDSEAEDVLQDFQHVLPDALLTPLDDPESNDAILFKLLAANPLMEQVPVVILASGDAEQRRQALRMGLTNLVFPPYDEEEVVLSTRLAIDRHRDESRLFGSLSQMSVADLLQMAEVGRRSGTIVLHREGRNGTIRVIEGVIVHGDIDDGRSGSPAVMEMATWEEGTFEADFSHQPAAGPLELVPSAMLLEAMRRLDEERRDSGAFAAIQEDVEDELPPELGQASVPEAPEEVVEVPVQVPSVTRRPKRQARPTTAAEAEILQVSIVVLNLLVVYSMESLAPGLLQRRLEGSRQRLEHEYPELRIFQVTPDCHIAIAFDITVVLTAEGLSAAVAAWISELLGVFERAMPGRFSPAAVSRLMEPLSERLARAGLDERLGLGAGS